MIKVIGKINLMGKLMELKIKIQIRIIFILKKKNIGN